MAEQPTPDPLADFDIHTVPYKTVSGHPILADISFPKDLQNGLHPVVVNWHGGALMAGSRNFRLFYPPWLEPFARRNSAIVISPDYRLLPECQISDILSDLESFWNWLHADFPTKLHELSQGAHTADLSRLVINGGSAGGWCALQQALNHPDEIRALMVQYPSVGMDDSVDTDDPRNAEKIMLGMPVWSRSKLDKCLGELKMGTPVTEGGFDRLPLFLAAKAWGYLAKWRAGSVSPVQRITEGAKLPPKIWLIHGRDDTVVPVSSSEQFVPVIQSFCPQTDVKVGFFPGEHGFDNQIDMAELENGLTWIEDAW